MFITGNVKTYSRVIAHLLIKSVQETIFSTNLKWEENA